ncbi:hypothetical protein T06_354 [Trichinella sp. T6]|nr:hypothetical protein T06_354 [Trichinella sp. T6]
MLAYSEIALLSGLCLVLLVGLLAGCLFRKKKKEKKPLKRMKPENPRPIKLAERPTPPGQTCPGTFVKKSCPCLGSNQGPSACKADVITATLQGHPFTRSST